MSNNSEKPKGRLWVFFYFFIEALALLFAIGTLVTMETATKTQTAVGALVGAFLAVVAIWMERKLP